VSGGRGKRERDPLVGFLFSGGGRGEGRGEKDSIGGGEFKLPGASCVMVLLCLIPLRLEPNGKGKGGRGKGGKRDDKGGGKKGE